MRARVWGGGGDRRSALSRGEKLGVGIHHANNDHTAGAETAIVTGQSEEERHRTPRTHTHARTHARTNTTADLINEKKATTRAPASALTDGIGIPRDAPDDAQPRILAFGHVVHQQVHQEEVAEVIDAHAGLESVVRPRRFGIRGTVHRRVAHEVIQRSDALERLEIEHEVSYGLETPEFEFHHDVGVVGHAHLPRDPLALLDVPACHHDEVTAGPGQGRGAVEPEAGGRAGDDRELAGADLQAPEGLRRLLVPGEVDLLGEFGLREHRGQGGAGGGE